MEQAIYKVAYCFRFAGIACDFFAEKEITLNGSGLTIERLDEIKTVLVMLNKFNKRKLVRIVGVDKVEKATNRSLEYEQGV
jgi:hypothetical protein